MLSAYDALRRANTIRVCGMTIVEFDPNHYLLPIVDEIDQTFKGDLTMIEAVGGIFWATHFIFQCASFGPQVSLAVNLQTPPIEHLFGVTKHTFPVIIWKNYQQSTVYVSQLSDLASAIKEL